MIVPCCARRMRTMGAFSRATVGKRGRGHFPWQRTQAELVSGVTCRIPLVASTGQWRDIYTMFCRGARPDLSRHGRAIQQPRVGPSAGLPWEPRIHSNRTPTAYHTSPATTISHPSSGYAALDLSSTLFNTVGVAKGGGGPRTRGGARLQRADPGLGCTTALR